MTIPTSRKVWAHRPALGQNGTSPALLIPIELGDPLNAGAFGGTASVHRIKTAPYLYMAAKVFSDEVLPTRRSPETHAKLQFIASASDPLKRGYLRAGKLHPGRPHVAWPEALLYEDNAATPDRLVGFAMPVFADGLPLAKLTSPKHRKTNFPQLADDGLLLAAQNIAGAVDNLHGAGGSSGLVFGDLNTRNILVRVDLSCQFIDADSYQYTVGGTIHGSGDTTPGFRSPRMAEAARTGKALPRFTTEDDNYALAIVLFHVLVDGAHPWTAGERFEVGGVKPDEEENMLSRRFPYADPATLYPPKIRLQTYQKLPADIRKTFETAFLGAPAPTAAQWVDVLKRTRAAMRASP